MSINLKTDESRERVWLCDDNSHPLTKPNEFLRVLELRGLSPQTLRAYGYDLVAFYRWLRAFGKEPIGLKVQDLLEFIGTQREAGLAARSINRRLTTVQAFCHFCSDAVLSSNSSPYHSKHYLGRGRDRCLGLHKVRQPKHRLLQIRTPRNLVEPLTVKQVELFLQTLSRYRDLCIVYLMLFCGLRSREVLQARLQDVSFDEQQLRVQGKGNKERILPLPIHVLDAVKRYLTLERPKTSNCEFLFVVLQGRRKGQPMTPSGLRSLFRHRRLKAALKNANAHRWRHTFGTDMARAGSTVPVLQRLMGHSDMRITMQYINLSMADIACEFHRASETIQRRYKRL